MFDHFNSKHCVETFFKGRIVVDTDKVKVTTTLASDANAAFIHIATGDRIVESSQEMSEGAVPAADV